MSNELIERLYEESQNDTESLGWKAADLIEQHQKRIEGLERKIEFWRDKAKDQTHLAAAQAHLSVMREALENCRLIAARYRKEEWAQHTLRICAEAGVTGSPLRQDDSALRELLKAERERVAQRIETLIGKEFIGKHVAGAIRSMEDQ